MVNKRQSYEVLKKNRCYFGCLGKINSIKNCKVSPCGISGCDKKEDFATKSNSGSLPFVTATLINPDTCNSVNICALQDTRSTGLTKVSKK